ncbi:TetR/AcrR family transcriptional regulator [Cryobacterium sp. Hb1]|uniref:TetR/AcrR family transcriptional regulator n=1 Tax=Cryobacterium sp. Hb1 TaxID=1259147 RepID=UPI00106A24B5|nr:TetR/AcrR family transcriptional regulator [Cryobacterium sp. Hb1]TFD71070.1 TetR/AcrR family transcriptional regulator [Cryobacterium sp. Hb1]
MFTEHVHSRAQARDTSRIKVLSAAEVLFVRHGFASTTIRQIAESAAVSVGTVMAVADKNGLLVEVVDRKIASIQPSSFDVPIAQDPAAEIIDILGSFVRFFADQPDLARAYTAILVGGKHRSVIFAELTGVLVEQVSKVLTRAGHSATDASATARIIHRAYLGEIFIWAGQGNPNPDSTLTELAKTVRYLVNGKVA